MFNILDKTGRLPKSGGSSTMKKALPAILLVMSTMLPVSSVMASLPLYSAGYYELEARSLEIGSNVDNVVAADVTGDGVKDLVLVNTLTQKVIVYHGAKFGGFTKKTEYPAKYPASVAVADVTNDGNLDIITSGLSGAATNTQDIVSVLVNNGSGGFFNGVNYTVGNNPFALTVADVTGDGNVDIITANLGVLDTTIPGHEEPDTITILAGDGSGSFSLVEHKEMGDKPYDIAAADFDNDGDNDLVIASLAVYSSSPSALNYLENDGSGSFSINALSVGAPIVTDIDLSDINKDGDLDILVTKRTAAPASDTVGFLLGNGDGNFASFEAVAIPSGFTPLYSKAADVTGDGFIDLISVSINNYNSLVAVFENDQSGNFSAMGEYYLPIKFRDPLIHDVNKDGYPDILTVGNMDGSERTLSFMINKAGAGFTDMGNYHLGTSSSISMVVKDVTGDGAKDILATNEGDKTINFFKNDGAGNFAAAGPINTLEETSEMILPDLNNDGLADLVYLYGSYNLIINAGTPGGPFNNANYNVSFATHSYVNNLYAGYINSDNWIDIIGISLGANKNVVLFVTQAGNTIPASNITNFAPTNEASSADVGDLNGDSFADIVLAHEALDKVTVLINDGTGSYPAANRVLYKAGDAPDFVTIVDAVGDNSPDLIVGSSTANTITILENDGSAQYPTDGGLSFAGVADPDIVRIADVNGDSNADMIVGSSSTSSDLIILAGDGNGGFSTQADSNDLVSHYLGYQVQQLSVTDISGDGEPEIVAQYRNSAHYYVAVLDKIKYIPVALDASLEVDENAVGYGTLEAKDPQNDPVTFAVPQKAQHGEVTFKAATGEYSYAPDTDYSGEDSFSYIASSNSGDSSPATVSIIVKPAPTGGDTGGNIGGNTGNTAGGGGGGSIGLLMLFGLLGLGLLGRGLSRRL